jgi:glycine/D-amino acid oxidase-like deaminating enzyme
MRRERVPVLIAGAGLQGSCIALELARLGIRVALLDQDAQPMNRASLRNEGKIHLGLMYANDRTFQSARLQLSGALRFRRLLQRWTGRGADRLRTSTSFIYLVARDSVLEPDALAHHYARVEEEYRYNAVLIRNWITSERGQQDSPKGFRGSRRSSPPTFFRLLSRRRSSLSIQTSLRG